MWDPIDLVLSGALLAGLGWVWWAWTHAIVDPNLPAGLPRARAHLRAAAIAFVVCVVALVWYAKLVLNGQ